MAIVSMKNSGVQNTILATPTKLMGPRIKPCTFLGTSLRVDTPIGLGTMFVINNDYGVAHGTELHIVEDPTFHQHLVILALEH